MSDTKIQPLAMSSRYRKKGKGKRQFITTTAVDIFTPEERDKMHKSNRSWEYFILQKFDPFQIKPEDVVQEARLYFKHRYQNQVAGGRQRKSPWLNSASSALTGLKKTLRAQKLADFNFTVRLNLTKRELALLDKLNHRRLEANAQNLQDVDAVALLTKLLELLGSEEPEKIVLGLLGLSGRRQAEITHSAQWGPPQNAESHRYPSFWAHTTGFLKQKANDKFAVRARELPLLAPREQMNAALAALREAWPSDTHQQAGRLYAKKIARSVKRELSEFGIHKAHDLRKFFAPVAHRYFNNRQALPAFASFVLGHKRTVSTRILTYLSLNVIDIPHLQWIFDHSVSHGLREDRPEEKLEHWGEDEVLTPRNTDSEDYEEMEDEGPTKERHRPPPRDHNDQKKQPSVNEMVTLFGGIGV